jgi:hypothetical protein
MFNLENVKTDLIMPEEVLDEIQYLTNYRKQVPDTRYRNPKVKALSNSKYTGLDGISAFYLKFYTGLDTPTRHPNIFEFLSRSIDHLETVIETSVQDTALGMIDAMQFCAWHKNSPRWVIDKYMNSLSAKLQMG